MGPGRHTEISLIASYRVPVGTSDFEAWVLANLAKTARAMFGFGTATGKTAYLLARNSPAGTRVVTLTLAPDQVASYRQVPGDARDAAALAAKESRFRTYY